MLSMPPTVSPTSLADQLLQSLTNDTAFKGGGVHKRKPTEFVAELFDQFADTFDDKLVNTTWWGMWPSGGMGLFWMRGVVPDLRDVSCIHCW